jgi:hypothetical protein
MISLQTLLNHFPDVKLAQARDDDRIRHFFHSRPMNSKNFFLSYERNPSFFDFIKLQGHAYYVFYVENDAGVIEGCGSLSIRHSRHLGEACQIGYLADLRVSNIRKWGRVWRDFYEALITQAAIINELAQIKLFYTCLLLENKKAYNSLVINKTNLSYTHFHNYQMFNVFASIVPVSSHLIEMKNWSEIELDQLKQFYRQNSVKTPYAYCFENQHNELDRRFNNFPQFDANNGIALYHAGKMVAACSFWSPSSCKKIIMHNQTKGMLLLGKVLGLPKNEEELKCLYLFGLQFADSISQDQKTNLFKIIISTGLKRARRMGFHCLSFSSFEKSHKFNLFPYFIAHSTSLAMYVVHPKSETNNLNLVRILPPAFEIGLI